MLGVKDIKPSLGVKDIKPSLGKVSGETVIFTDPSVLNAGQPMGLLLALTYPVSLGTVQATRR